MPVWEVWELQEDRVKRLATCGSEEDARMMMMLGDKQRSWIKCECEDVLLESRDFID